MPILKIRTLERILAALVFQSLKFRDNSQIFTKKVKQAANLFGQLHVLSSSLSVAVMTPAIRFLNFFTQIFEQKT